jgi:MerR family transcriptional regulator/heat shock protein HspR
MVVARGSRPVYVISIAASLTGCHPRTLRIYEEEGLLDPVRTVSNIRLYSDEDLRRVRCIRYFTQVRGVNLAGVKLLLQLLEDELLDQLTSTLGEEEASGGARVGVAEPAPGDRKRREAQRRGGER